MNQQARQPAGSPKGGQFTAMGRSESGVQLHVVADTDDDLSPRQRREAALRSAMRDRLDPDTYEHWSKARDSRAAQRDAMRDIRRAQLAAFGAQVSAQTVGRAQQAWGAWKDTVDEAEVKVRAGASRARDGVATVGKRVKVATITATQNVKDRASQVAESARERTQQTKESVQNRATQARESVAERAQQAKTGMQDAQARAQERKEARQSKRAARRERLTGAIQDAAGSLHSRVDRWADQRRAGGDSVTQYQPRHAAKTVPVNAQAPETAAEQGPATSSAPSSSGPAPRQQSRPSASGSRPQRGASKSGGSRFLDRAGRKALTGSVRSFNRFLRYITR